MQTHPRSGELQGAFCGDGVDEMGSSGLGHVHQSEVVCALPAGLRALELFDLAAGVPAKPEAGVVALGHGEVE